MHVSKKIFSKGLTLVEILIVITILALISVITYEALFSVKKKEVLEKEAARVSAIIERARSLTLSSSGDRQYGVHVESNRVVTFRGNSYNSSDLNNKADTLNNAVTISNYSFAGGGDNVIFERLSGKTGNAGTLTMSLSSATTTYTITIYGTGLVDVKRND